MNSDLKLKFIRVGEKWYAARRPLPAVPVSSVPPSYQGPWSPFEMQTFDAITKGNDFDEKRFLRHPLVENLSNRSLKSIRKVIDQRKKELQIAAEEVVVDKTKKKWTLKEDEAIEAVIARHGHKIKLIIRDEKFDVGLADKTVKHIEKMAKIGIKTLKNRRGTKANAAGSPPKPTKSGSLGDAARAALLVSVKGVFKNKTVLERLAVGGFGVFSDETFLDLIAKLVHDDYVKRIA